MTRLSSSAAHPTTSCSSVVALVVVVVAAAALVAPNPAGVAAFQQQQQQSPSPIHHHHHDLHQRRIQSPPPRNSLFRRHRRHQEETNLVLVRAAAKNDDDRRDQDDVTSSTVTAFLEQQDDNDSPSQPASSATGSSLGSTSGSGSGEIESYMDQTMDWIEEFRVDAIEAPDDELSLSGSEGDGTIATSGLLWRGVVVALCALWASNFAVIKLVLAEPGVDSSLFAVARFGAAALALAPFALSSVRRSGMDAETLRGAVVCGSCVAFGYIGQLLGLLTTTASRSCVICSLHCVFVAGIAEFIRTSKSTSSASFDLKKLAPAAVAVVGVAVVELWGAGGASNIGDLISFAQPIGFGLGYLKLEELMSRRPDTALPVSAIKLAIVALASMLYFELGPLLDFSTATEWTLRLPDFSSILDSPVALTGVLYTGLVTTALALWVESIAFARVPATDASIILTTEPLFAALFGAITLGEVFGLTDYVGASLIIGACVLATLMDTPGDKECIPDDKNSCEPPRKWPFWGF